jgi:hypothetical protein
VDRIERGVGVTYQSKTPSPEHRETGPAEGIGLDDANLLLEILPDAKPPKATRFAFESVLNGRQEVALGGRNRWTLRRLIERGNRGLTAAECPPGLRLAALVHNLRKAGIPITSEIERHTGDFPGNHVRYVLDVRVTEILR